MTSQPTLQETLSPVSKESHLTESCTSCCRGPSTSQQRYPILTYHCNLLQWVCYVRGLNAFSIHWITAIKPELTWKHILNHIFLINDCKTKSTLFTFFSETKHTTYAFFFPIYVNVINISICKICKKKKSFVLNNNFFQHLVRECTKKLLARFENNQW